MYYNNLDDFNTYSSINLNFNLLATDPFPGMSRLKDLVEEINFAPQLYDRRDRRGFKEALLSRGDQIGRIALWPISIAAFTIFGMEVIKDSLELPNIIDRTMPFLQIAITLVGLKLASRAISTGAKLKSLGNSIRT